MEAISFSATPQTMYNFTVAVAHTYFVGEGQWLVHNSCPLDELVQTHVIDLISNADNLSDLPSTVAVIRLADGTIYTGRSGGNVSEAIIDAFGASHPHGFNCAELDCLSQAGALNLQGATITTAQIRVRSDGVGGHIISAAFQDPCPGGCDTILNQLGVTVIDW